MRIAILLSAVVTASTLLGAEARAEDPAPRATVADVLAFMDTMPGEPGNPKSVAYHWSKKPGALAIAQAIAATAPDREWAARMAVYSIHEGGLSSECVNGDGGESWGAFQLKDVPHDVACDPAKAAPVWLAMAQRSMQDCAALPVSERMAELASGSCKKGHVVARQRETFVLRALATALPPKTAPSIE
jgi:hypothetical protein